MRAVRVVAAAVICVGLAGCGSGGSPPQAGASGGQVAAGSSEVSFVVDGTTTYGTLEVPAHRDGAHLAGAVLIAGSGPTDRDGNQPPGLTPNTLRQIADALSGMGIMSLRFDKYYTGRTGAGSHASDPVGVDLNGYIGQADAAYRMLAGQPAADQHKLLVVGHSEGGMYAMLVAETVTPHPAGLALVEPQDERLLDLLTLQINEYLDGQVSQGAITADTARQNAQLIRQAVARFRSTGQAPPSTGLLPAVVTMLTPFLYTPANARSALTDDAIDPAAYAAKLPRGTRVLVTDGTADRNIPPSTIRPLVNGLTSAGTTGPGLQLLSNLDHDLNPAGTPPNNAPLDPSFLAALRDWAQPYATGS